MATRKVSFTWNGANFAKIVALWGSETAYKAWVKQQTFDYLNPPDPDIYQPEYRQGPWT